MIKIVTKYSVHRVINSMKKSVNFCQVNTSKKD